MNRFILGSLAILLSCVTGFANEGQGQAQQQVLPSEQQEQIKQEEQNQYPEEVLPEEQAAEKYLSDDPSPRYLHHRGYQCVARDRGWEEHFRGHVARGRHYNHVYYRALYECLRYHGSCYVSCYRIH